MTATRRPIRHRPVPEVEQRDDWREEAVCRNFDPEVFFPEREGRRLEVRDRMIEEAKGVCRNCPVITECSAETEAFEISEGMTHGVRAGESADERIDRRRKAKRKSRAKV